MSLNYHYCGHIVASSNNARFPIEQMDEINRQVVNRLSSSPVTHCFGSLAAGADIIMAEQFLAQKCQLHFVLPFDTQSFIESSVILAGETWSKRFQNLVNKANSITHLYHKKPQQDELSYAVCTEIALGLALRQSLIDDDKSQPLNHCVHQLAIWDEESTEGIAGTFADLLRGKNLGLDADYLTPGKNEKKRIFSSNKKMPAQPLRLRITDTTRNQAKSITNLAALFTCMDRSDFEDSWRIDLEPSCYGKHNPSDNLPVTRRAVGQILYHCFCQTRLLAGCRSELPPELVTKIDTLVRMSR
jgi:hypothetical protein